MFYECVKSFLLRHLQYEPCRNFTEGSALVPCCLMKVLGLSTFQIGMFAKYSYYFNQFKFARLMILTEAIASSCDLGAKNTILYGAHLFHALKLKKCLLKKK